LPSCNLFLRAGPNGASLDRNLPVQVVPVSRSGVNFTLVQPKIETDRPRHFTPLHPLSWPQSGNTVNTSTLRLLVATSAIVAVGQLAGLLLGSGIDAYTRRNLTEIIWTQQHQAMDAVFRQFMPIYFNATALLLIAAALMVRGTARWLFAASALLTIFSIVITVAVEVPLNRTVAVWIPGSAPSGWTLLRDRWLWNHLIRTISCTLAFWLAAAGLPRL
jgi:uncharacterized membrane protein